MEDEIIMPIDQNNDKLCNSVFKKIWPLSGGVLLSILYKLERKYSPHMIAMSCIYDTISKKIIFYQYHCPGYCYHWSVIMKHPLHAFHEIIKYDQTGSAKTKVFCSEERGIVMIWNVLSQCQCSNSLPLTLSFYDNEGHKTCSRGINNTLQGEWQSIFQQFRKLHKYHLAPRYNVLFVHYL